MSDPDSRDKIAHGFGLPPWAMYGGHWTRWQKISWRFRHPRRAWRVALENWRARGNI